MKIHVSLFLIFFAFRPKFQKLIWNMIFISLELVETNPLIYNMAIWLIFTPRYSFEFFLPFSAKNSKFEKAFHWYWFVELVERIHWYNITSKI